MKSSIALFTRGLSLAALLHGAAVVADIETLCDALSPCTSSGEITVGLPGTLTVTWRGTVVQTNQNLPSEAISSNGGTFGAGSAILGSSFTPLSQTVIYGQGDTPFTIVETLSVPPSVSQAAADAGQTRLVYLREFASPGGRIFGSVSFPLKPRAPQLGGQAPTPQPTPPLTPGGTGPALTGVELSRVALRFEDDSLIKTLTQGEALRAQVQINYRNSGQLAGVWELATPASTQGVALYQPLENVRVYLGAGQKKTLASPRLPSEQLGLYRLRFRLLQPAVNQPPLEIQYLVGKASDVVVALRPIALSAPGAGATLTDATLFRWEGLPEAAVYRLELFDAEAAAPLPERVEDAVESDATEAKPATGMLVPASQREVLLSAVAAMRLQAGRDYQWRIVAIDEQGQRIGVSPLRRIRRP